MPIAVALIAGLTGGGMVPLVQAFRGRGRARVDAVDAMSDAAREWVMAFKAEESAARTETREARRELGEARREVGEARREVEELRREAHALAEDLRRLRLAILAPEATIDGLRDLVRGRS